MKKLNNKGFSLVELIIVIAIMVVLMGVLAPQFIRYVEKSKQGSDLNALDSCVTVIQAYYADKAWPSGGVTISGAASAAYSITGNTSAATELTNAGCDKYSIKGTWSSYPQVTLAADGTITFSGNSDYYEANSSTNNLFVAK